jgi:UPF0042 nucleotide-binding protein
MRLVIVSGRSGSGKSTALHVLEDLGYYCIDNLPTGLLLDLCKQSTNSKDDRLSRVAVSIDARNLESGIVNFSSFYNECLEQNIQIDIIFLDSRNDVLLKRFNATRRKHPLSDTHVSLKEAIKKERLLLEPIAIKANLNIDTSHLSLYELRDLIKIRVAGRKTQELAILFLSFGFKHGVPIDADFVFDVRCLPNPYWDPNLRMYNGLEKPVQDFLAAQPEAIKMQQDIIKFLETWLPQYQDSNRSYMTISIGCTGGQHRSVYLCEQIGQYFINIYNNVQIRHKELPHLPKK